MRHSISGVDTETRLGVCTICGIGVPVVPNGTHWRCKTARMESQKRTSKSRHHGLTYTQMEELKVRIGRCQICGFSSELRVDHDHGNGRIRGILCNFCNTALYVVERDRTWGFKAAWYLWRTKWRRQK